MGTYFCLLLLLSGPNFLTHADPSIQARTNAPKVDIGFASESSSNFRIRTSHAAPPLVGLGAKLSSKLRRTPGPYPFLALGPTDSDLKQIGIDGAKKIGPVFSASASRDQLESLVRQMQGRKWRAESPQAFRLAIDIAKRTVAADEQNLNLFDQDALGGDEVIIGAYDSGIDFSHPAFSKAAQQRIIAVWDQDRDISCDEPQLNDQSCTLKDELGHGTSTMSIAASSHSKYPGIAPRASIAMVSSQNFNALIPSLAWLKELAQRKQRSLIVNLSLAGHEGPHDGTSLESLAINAYEHLVVTAAGNEGNLNIHISGTLSGTDSGIEVPINMNDRRGATTGIIEIWGAPQSRLEASIYLKDANGSILKKTDTTSMGKMGFTENLLYNDQILATIDLDSEPTPNNGNNRRRTRIRFNITELEVLADQALNLSLKLNGEGQFDAWLDAPSQTEVLPTFEDAFLLGPESRAQIDASKTVSDIATSSSAIAVSSMVNRNQITDPMSSRQYRTSSIPFEISNFSSYGPSCAPQITGSKPDIVAPGEFMLVAKSNEKSSPTVIANHWTIASGTSMSTPVVAGAAAVILGAAPKLRRDELRQIILETSVSLPVPMDTRSGAGLLDLQSALRVVLEPSSGCSCRNLPITRDAISPWTVGLLLLTSFTARRYRARRQRSRS